MLEFRDIQLSDRPWVTKLLKLSDFQGCEYSFANNLAWRRLNNTQISRLEDFYICRAFDEDTPYFTFPAGKGDYKKLICELKKVSESLSSPLIITSVGKNYLPLFEELFPGEYKVTCNPDYYDYIYNSSDLIDLKGKKYHSKRNHLTKFYAKSWSYEPLTEANQAECIELSVKSYNDRQGYTDTSSISEQFAINTFLTNFEELELKGGLIRVDGVPAAFTIGEPLNSDTFCIHIEKANAEITGSYAAINKEFALRNIEGFKFINREEDLGLEGLRKAKRSYYPAYQLEKYTIEFL